MESADGVFEELFRLGYAPTGRLGTSDSQLSRSSPISVASYPSLLCSAARMSFVAEVCMLGSSAEMLDRRQVDAAALDSDWSPALDQATLAFATAVCVFLSALQLASP
jgi:hypothetical protein